MAEPTSDIHMEDSDPASNDHMYLPDFDGLHTTFVYDEYLSMDMNTILFNQLPEGHNGMLLSSSTNLFPLEQFLVPQEQTLESDTLFSSPNASQCNCSTWTHGHTIDGAQEPTSANMITDNSIYPQANIFSVHQDCQFEDVYRNLPGPSAGVDMHGYGGFPFGTTCHTSAPSCLPDSNPLYAKDHDFVRQETYNGDSDLCMTHAVSADYGWSTVQDHTPNSWDQSIGFNPPPDTESCFPVPRSPLLTQHTTSALSSSLTQPMAWQFANSAPVPQPLAQGNKSSSKRKRTVPNDVDRELMLHGWEQRVSKRANIPPSSVNIVSFEGEERFRVVRGCRTKLEKESMQELTLVGGSCTRCEHARKKCEKQTPCTGCVKFWNRNYNKSLSQAKRAGSGSVVKHSVIAKQTRCALVHIYNKIDAVRHSGFNLPKLLSVLDILSSNERRFLQSVFTKLPSKTLKDIGCYSYVFKTILDTVTLPCRSLRIAFSDESPRGHVMQCLVRNASYFDKHAIYRSEIIGHVSGMDVDVESIYYVPQHLETKDAVCSMLPVEQSFKQPKFLQLPILRPSSTWYHYGLCPLGPYPVKLVEMIKHAAQCMHTFNSSVGAPLIVSRVEHAKYELRKLDAPGWLTYSSVPNADFQSSDTEAEDDTLAVQAVDNRGPARIDLDTILKLTQKRLELELKRELKRELPQAGKGMWNISM